MKLVKLGAGSLALAAALSACGSSGNPLAQASQSLTSSEVHFCFVSTAKTAGASSEVNGCGDENVKARKADAQIASQVTVGTQSQKEAVRVVRISGTEWLNLNGHWYKVSDPFPSSSPLDTAAIVAALPSVSKIPGIRVNGKRTVGYQEKITGNQLAKDLGSNFKTLKSEVSAVKNDTIQVYLNSKDQVVKVIQHELLVQSNQEIPIVSYVTFSAFGEHVAIVPPPANEVSSHLPSSQG